MAGNKIKDFFNGFIIVRVEGLNPEKFINICSKNGIKLWDINKISYTAIEFKMQYREYHYLKSIIRKTSSRTRIIRKRGINFLYTKVRRRKFFIAGIAIFLAIMLYLSNIVWIIDIYGNKSVDTTKIYDVIKLSGLKEGSLKNSIKLRDVESKILNEIHEISLVNIKFIGTRAKVEVVERTMPPQIIPLDKPTNIIACKNGIVTKILSYKGQPLVEPGDYVKSGQILISGIITDSTNVPSKIVHAMGVVNAKTWYESKQEIKLNYQYETRTGRLKKKVYYNIMGKKVCIKNANIDYKNYDKMEEKKMLKIIGFEAPIECLTEYYYEKVEQSKRLTVEEAIKFAQENAENEIKATLQANQKILDKKVNKGIEKDKVKVSVLYIIEENIGILNEIK